MKKLILGLLTTVLVFGGLVASSEVTASAAPYPGTVKTKVIAAGIQANKRHHAAVFVKVSSFGKGKPTGKVNFTFVNKRSGKVYSFTRSYSGQNKYYFSGLQSGKYAISVLYNPPNNSKYKASSAKAFVKVK